ncbi:helix-turn-helix domain-containing protein [Selenomonas artemidis]|uniref:helix-turn-helix domain-containing protein n=1 Tax=Selenomonas artemidis TaxID=671224 RepID=UPI0023F33552|nr:helix-turn-helix transcriptional regulator [Selenomonas artemidis]
MSLGEKLRTLREKRCMTQTDLAAATGLARRSIYNWEKGKSMPKNIGVLELLSHALHVDLQYWSDP